MIAYEVVADVEQAVEGRYERYMRETHIPEVLATGCFQGAIFARSSPGRYRTSAVVGESGEQRMALRSGEVRIH